MKRNILFITTHNLATNPRIYKEIQLAINSGYKTEIICFEFENWSKEINEQLKQQLGEVKIISIPAGRDNFFLWFSSVLTEKTFRMLGNLFTLPIPVLSQAVSRRNNLLIKALEKASPPHLVIGHNPGAIWPALKAGKKFNCRVGFDVEDYHPGEGNDSHVQNLTKQLLAKLLPKMSYVSFAAPLIMQATKKDVDAPVKNWFTVLNYFPGSEFIEPVNQNNGLVKMVWFSQNINAGRGLELILPFIKASPGLVELYLIGHLNADFHERELKDISNIFLSGPLPQKELHQSLSGFDIGLALETAKDKNNELAISNKMLAYLQAGLFVVATNTIAQESFLAGLPGHGLCFDYKSNNSTYALEKVINDINSIRENKHARYKNFENRNWENASLDLLTEWSK